MLGRVEGGSFTPMAQDGQGGIVLDGSDWVDDPGSFGGEASAVSSERRLWAMLESLPGTSYHLPRRRLYDGDTGRFASQDPIGLLGGDHRFAYLGNDPNSGVDPSGLMWQEYQVPSDETHFRGGANKHTSFGWAPWLSLDRECGALCQAAQPLGAAEGKGKKKPKEDDDCDEVDIYEQDKNLSDKDWLTKWADYAAQHLGHRGDDETDPATEPRGGNKPDGTESRGRDKTADEKARMASFLAGLDGIDVNIRLDLGTDLFGSREPHAPRPSAGRQAGLGAGVGAGRGSSTGQDALVGLAVGGGLVVTGETVAWGTIGGLSACMAVPACRSWANDRLGELRRLGHDVSFEARDIWWRLVNMASTRVPPTVVVDASPTSATLTDTPECNVDPSGNGAGKATSSNPDKSITSLRKRLAEHRQKLADYKSNPDAADNLGLLREAATPEIRKRIIEGRVRHLEQEIKAFEKAIQDLGCEP